MDTKCLSYILSHRMQRFSSNGNISLRNLSTKKFDKICTNRCHNVKDFIIRIVEWQSNLWFLVIYRCALLHGSLLKMETVQKFIWKIKLDVVLWYVSWSIYSYLRFLVHNLHTGKEKRKNKKSTFLIPWNFIKKRNTL